MKQLLAAITFMSFILAAVTAELPPLKAAGDQFADVDGNAVRLWGVNLVALYPDHATADKLAANLAGLGINAVRPHHMLRPSNDWNPDMPGGSLSLYQRDSQTPDPEAWDRFFYLTNALRQKGIYLLLAIGDSRSYQPGDWTVMDNGNEDNAAWRKAMEDLESRDWKAAIDVRKMLPLVDERAARIVENYARKLLTTDNPYSKKRFATDPQVVTVELLNEFSLDYTIICKNRLPEYQMKQVVKEWARFAAGKGVDPGDFMAPVTPAQIQTRGEFFEMLERRFIDRMQKVIRECGYRGSIIYSNLWRGESASKLSAVLNGSVEDHAYVDPRVYLKRKDFVAEKAVSKIAGKPYILGEFNISEGGKDMEDQKNKRAMLMLASAAYGSFQDWSGIVWFAWCHGGQKIGADGWGLSESRGNYSLGNMATDGVMLDHMRTASLIFRKQLVKKSVKPLVFAVESTSFTNNYNSLMASALDYPSGLQSMHAVAKVFGKATVESMAAAKEAKAVNIGEVLISDTGEIERNLSKKYLKVAAPAVNAWGGELTANGGFDLPNLSYQSPAAGFATVIMAAADGKALTASKQILISRTIFDAGNNDVNQGELRLRKLAPGQWSAVICRPRAAAGKVIELKADASGEIKLPLADWHEIELIQK